MPQLPQDKPNVSQHDGAASDIRNGVKTFLNMLLPERWIGRSVPFSGLRDLQI
jgi:hypothetical protein